MEAEASNAIIRKLWDFDKFCFNKCVKEFLIIEQCTIKVLNALDFINGVNEKGGIAPIAKS